MLFKNYNVVRKELYSANVIDITLTPLPIYFMYGAALDSDTKPLSSGEM